MIIRLSGGNLMVIRMQNGRPMRIRLFVNSLKNRAALPLSRYFDR
jgi:hypothetical protein